MDRPEFDNIKDFEEFSKYYWYNLYLFFTITELLKGIVMAVRKSKKGFRGSGHNYICKV